MLLIPVGRDLFEHWVGSTNPALSFATCSAGDRQIIVHQERTFVTQNYLDLAFPRLGRGLPRESLGQWPTPVAHYELPLTAGLKSLQVKCDNLSSRDYAGNKVRKLEYALAPARRWSNCRIATFGAAGSNHAVATALHAQRLGYACTCFLAGQPQTDFVRQNLNMHLKLGTQLVEFGGAYAQRVATLREHLRKDNYWLIPVGGSSWRGTVGFINAGLELAQQIADGELPAPQRLYVAMGTMGTVAGLAIGLALAGLATEIQAIRVTELKFANPAALRRLMRKTVHMLRRIDPSLPEHIVDRVRIRCRDEFLGPGYAVPTAAGRAAVSLAKSALNLQLETTYTGKAFAALLSDLEDPALAAAPLLFWNTYNSRALGVPRDRPLDPERLPPAFRNYFETGALPEA